VRVAVASGAPLALIETDVLVAAIDPGDPRTRKRRHPHSDSPLLPIALRINGARPPSSVRASLLVDELYRLRIVDVRTEYGNAASLHKNFYQVHLGRLTVSACINKVRELIDKIEAAITDLVERREVLPWGKPLYAALGQLHNKVRA